MNPEQALLIVKAKMKDKKFLQPVTPDKEMAKTAEILERGHRNSAQQVRESLTEKQKLEAQVKAIEEFYSRGNKVD